MEIIGGQWGSLGLSGYHWKSLGMLLGCHCGCQLVSQWVSLGAQWGSAEVIVAQWDFVGVIGPQLGSVRNVYTPFRWIIFNF